jgi:hypothetical protein
MSDGLGLSSRDEGVRFDLDLNRRVVRRGPQPRDSPCGLDLDGNKLLAGRLGIGSRHLSRFSTENGLPADLESNLSSLGRTTNLR